MRRALRRIRLGELRSAAVETWGFIWIMLILKIPLVMLLYTVWWAIKQVPDPAVDDSTDGGSGDRTPPPEPQPRTPRRRGPHGEPTPPAPPRTRTKVRSRDRTVK